MLIFGDVATNKVYPSHIIKIVEILYHDEEELEFICQKFGLEKLLFNGVHHREYYKHGKIYRLTSKKVTAILGKIMNDAFAGKCVVKVANPYINFILDTCKVVNYHGKFEDWIQRVKSYGILSALYIQDLIDLDEKYNDLISKYHNLLDKFVDVHQQLSRRSYVYHPYSAVSKGVLLATVSTKEVNHSPYHNITELFISDEDEYLSEEKFDKLTYQSKLTACVESLYIDTLNEFVVPHYKDKQMLPTDKEVFRAFKKCIMYRATQRKMRWFGIFMVDNYLELIGEYDIGFYRVFQNVLREGEVVITT